jgi:hypothetical protein
VMKFSTISLLPFGFWPMIGSTVFMSTGGR